MIVNFPFVKISRIQSVNIFETGSILEIKIKNRYTKMSIETYLLKLLKLILVETRQR